VAIAVAAERLSSSAAPAAPAAARSGGLGGSDISGFIARPGFDSMVPAFRMTVRIDPFGPGASSAIPAVASGAGTRTVRPSATNSSGRVLTAILVANDRRVAVIDDAAVGVGDVLSDGTRVSAIQPSKVFLVDTKGRFHTLVLTNRGQ
jgi:hypothetical protein